MWIQGGRGEVYLISGLVGELPRSKLIRVLLHALFFTVEIVSPFVPVWGSLAFACNFWWKGGFRVCVGVLFSHISEASHTFWWNLNWVFCQRCKRSQVFYTIIRFNTSILYWSKLFFAFLVNETMILYLCLQK